MSDLLEVAEAKLNKRIKPGDIDFSVKFVVEDGQCLRVDEGGVSRSDADADLTLTATADVFEGILSGAVNPASAMMTGKLSVGGDMGLAMKLGAALS